KVRQVDHHAGLAHVARIPAPALHVGDDSLDLPVARRAVELADRLHIKRAGDLELVGALIFLYRFRELGVVSQVGGIARHPAPAPPSGARSSGTRGSSIGTLVSLSSGPAGISPAPAPECARSSASLAFRA